ncbi:WD40/YVTN/BNR-like repeat-containing protein [Actinomadura macrotermitis]|uniref:Uncharacterized protein n=1 Tax=Actinomadura macrotermitis TaxID=2585200 RepID=A0A7K0BW17_9ACTN|nr:hypothetical protein [Actinomadura macrotermitis]MQY05368.1 hypothetical protein [Actinomadura macrotermitis]
MNRQQTQGHTGVTGTVLALSGDAPAGRPVARPIVEGPHLLSGVAATPAGEVWVAGNAGQRPLAARWDGTSWTLPPGPPLSAALVGASLQDIAAGPDGRVVAVGGALDRIAQVELPLLHEWDGASWTAWDDGLRGRVLTGVATAGGETWAVGHGFPWGGAAGPVVLRRADGGWLPEEVPQLPKGKLLAVAGTGPDDVWAVGADDRAGLILHRDGRSWRRVPHPATRFPLTGVAAVSPGEAWAVGRDRVLRWNGRKWSRVKAPVTGANTVAAAGPGEVWVAGGNGELARFDGRRWTAVPSPPPYGPDAVWLAATAARDGIWLAGSHRLTAGGAVGESPAITARSGDS